MSKNRWKNVFIKNHQWFYSKFNSALHGNVLPVFHINFAIQSQRFLKLNRSNFCPQKDCSEFVQKGLTLIVKKFRKQIVHLSLLVDTQAFLQVDWTLHSTDSWCDCLAKYWSLELRKFFLILVLSNWSIFKFKIIKLNSISFNQLYDMV